jgi:uncharacterized protein (DUF433 family)
MRLPGVLSCGPEVHSGAVVFAGTRVPVRRLLDSLELGEPVELFHLDFPSVTDEQIAAVLALLPPSCWTR